MANLYGSEGGIITLISDQSYRVGEFFIGAPTSRGITAGALVGVVVEVDGDSHRSGVSSDVASAGNLIAVATKGVFRMGKGSSSEVITAGQKVYSLSSTSNIFSTKDVRGGFHFVGYALNSVPTGNDSVDVFLVQGGSGS